MLPTYDGSCHCGYVRFRVMTEISQVRECNCSICFMRGTLNIRVSEDQLEIFTPLSAMKLYQWGRKTAKDYFCTECGVLTFRRPGALTDEEIRAGRTPFFGWAVNARCLRGLDFERLSVVKIDGLSL